MDELILYLLILCLLICLACNCVCPIHDATCQTTLDWVTGLTVKHFHSFMFRKRLHDAVSVSVSVSVAVSVFVCV